MLFVGNDLQGLFALRHCICMSGFCLTRWDTFTSISMYIKMCFGALALRPIAVRGQLGTLLHLRQPFQALLLLFTGNLLFDVLVKVDIYGWHRYLKTLNKSRSRKGHLQYCIAD